MISFLIVSILFIMSQGFFAGMETGMVSVMRPRVEHAAKNGSYAASLMLFFVMNPGIMIATCLIGVNISVVMASLMMKKFVESIGFGSGVGLLVTTAILSVILLSCEILPKNWFRQAPYERCSQFIFILYAVYLMLFLPVRLFAAFTDFLSRLMSSVGHNSTTNALMREDFRLFLRESETTGSIDKATCTILDKAVDIPGMKVSEIMTVKAGVTDIPAAFSIREAFDFCRARNMIKAPVYSVSADGTHVWNGVFNIYDAIFSVDEKLWDTTKAVSCLRPLHELDGNSTLSETLEHSRKNKVSMFAIVDPENHSRIGILKPEDIAGMLFE